MRRRAVEPASFRLEPVGLVDQHRNVLPRAGELVLGVVVHAEGARLPADFRVFVSAELIERTLRPVPLLPAVRNVQETGELPFLVLERRPHAAGPIRVGIADHSVGDIRARESVGGEVDRSLCARAAQRVDVALNWIDDPPTASDEVGAVDHADARARHRGRARALEPAG